jgi:hypothetical protein
MADREPPSLRLLLALTVSAGASLPTLAAQRKRGFGQYGGPTLTAQTRPGWSSSQLGETRGQRWFADG